MRTIVVDKVASVTQACGLGHEVRIATDGIPAEEGVVVLWDKSALDEDSASRWAGPYLESAVPKDMWGHEWVYVFPAEDVAVGFDIVSVGPDGQENTEDDISLAKGKGNQDGDFGDFNSGSSSSSTGGTASPR